MAQYAIISLGGKQYVVKEGENLLVDRLDREEGKTFQPDVLFLGGDGGGELAPKSSVTAKIVGHERGPKVRIGKYKPKSGYKRHTGFRSSLTRIEVTGIGARKAPAKAESKPAAKAEEAPRRGTRGSEGAPEGLRRDDRRADLGGREELEPADARGGARLRAGTREAQGRARRDRVTRSTAKEES